MSIWHNEEFTSETLNTMGQQTMTAQLGIQFTETGEDYLKATMPVDERTIQPMGLLHGGASVSLAESMGSVAGTLCVDWQKQGVVGVEVNANHLRSVISGQTVTGTVKPLHIGRQTQVWEIKIHDDSDRLCCVSRITLSVINLSQAQQAHARQKQEEAGR
ncbi:MAG: hypothetical protein BRD50_09280 [Bacteroidetes bacterium SW_11_45_7]|nr:MAG: hypothetical protein BRD50_09280 [Bacteroidetes bacterium SW_11_45_7]